MIALTTECGQAEEGPEGMYLTLNLLKHYFTEY